MHIWLHYLWLHIRLNHFDCIYDYIICDCNSNWIICYCIFDYIICDCIYLNPSLRIVYFIIPICSGINFDSIYFLGWNLFWQFQPKQDMKLWKFTENCKIMLSVDSWPVKRKDIQLLIQYLIGSCMSFLLGGQLSTDKSILQLVYIFIVPFPLWAGISFNSSPHRKLNYENVHKL